MKKHQPIANHFFSLPETKEVDWAGLRFVDETTKVRTARDGKFDTYDVSQSQGVMVEVLHDGQFGYAATTRIDLEGLSQATRRAKRIAEIASQFRLKKFSIDQRPPIKDSYQGPIFGDQSATREKKAVEILIEATKRMKKNSVITLTEGLLRTVENHVEIYSSAGSSAEQETHHVTMDFMANAEKNGISQHRSNHGLRGHSWQGDFEVLFQDSLWQRVDQITEEALELVDAPDCPNDTRDLLLMPDQMMLQIHEAIGHPLELDRILGDERNYAGWSFVKLSDFGKLQYGSRLLNVTFDPGIRDEFASYLFDDTGNKSSKVYLIKNGILINGLGGLESQNRSGVGGVANMRATSWNRAPIDRMANLNIEPGTSTMKEMISSVQKGVLMESNRSWSIDDYRNKFQFGCEYAKLIENGKLTKTVRSPNYRGVSTPFWNSLKMVGNASTFESYGTPYCGKGEPNQIIRVGHASPPCLFSNVEVFGGAS